MKNKYGKLKNNIHNIISKIKFGVEAIIFN